jgi:hypothetical protein
VKPPALPLRIAVFRSRQPLAYRDWGDGGAGEGSQPKLFSFDFCWRIKTIIHLFFQFVFVFPVVRI